MADHTLSIPRRRLCVGLFTLSAFCSVAAMSAPAIDLRHGVRTSFYGGGFGQGSSVGDFYGWAMAFGDVDGDGFTDFLSSSANSEGPNDLFDHENDVYLIFGRPRAEIDSVYAVDTPGGADVVFYRGGFAMACADINNDGYDDVILANGEIYVVYGGPRTQLRPVYDFNATYPNGAPNPDYTAPDVHIIGSTKLGGAVINVLGSYSVLRALSCGDLNGDGFSDIVFGNYVACDPPDVCLSGATYIVFGKPRDRLPPLIDVDYASILPHPDVRILGDDNDHYSANIAIGDLDGDGVDDLVASAWAAGENNTTPGIGEVHGWWGKPAWKARYDTQIDDFDFALQGTPETSTDGPYQVGRLMSIADVDGDGRGDLLLGALDGDRADVPPDRGEMGEYRIIFGRSRGLWPKWSSAVDMTDVLILGAHLLDGFVSTLQWSRCFSFSTGNVNKDRYQDVLIGAGHALRDDDGTRPGAAYLLLGRPRSAWQPFIDLRDDYDLLIEGADYTGSTGYQFDLTGFVTGMGDLDGNGRDELFVAAPFADGPNNSIPDCGEIYVVYDDAAPPTWASTPILDRSALLPNFPNPFAGSTTFRISAPRGTKVSLTIYDALGRKVAQPVNTSTVFTEQEDVVWNAVDASGRELPSGIYFAKLRAGNETHARKVLLVR